MCAEKTCLLKEGVKVRELLLVTAHLLGDFYFQSESMSRNKRDNPGKLILHSFIYVIPFAAVLLLYGSWVLIAVGLPVLFAMHFIIDSIKVKFMKIFDSGKADLIFFVADQLIHAAVIIELCIVMDVFPELVQADRDITNELAGISDILFFVMSALICIKPASIFIKHALNAMNGASTVSEDKGVTGGGSIIGVLERLISLALGYMGLYSLIGLVLTAKSIARFEQLKEKEFAEKYLVGTLASLAVVTALLLIRYFSAS